MGRALFCCAISAWKCLRAAKLLLGGMPVQWLQLALWLTTTIVASRKGWRWFPAVLMVGLLVSMGGQLVCLARDGRLSLETAGPFHLCGFSALLCLPLLVRPSGALLAWQLYLGAPCAMLALCFPAIVDSGWPMLMAASFFRLHVLILCATVWTAARRAAQSKPLPSDPSGVLVAVNVYAVGVSVLNRVLNANYLFLRQAPVGTPLETLAARGAAGYVAALELGCVLLFCLLRDAYGAVNAYRCNRHMAMASPSSCDSESSAEAKPR